MSILLLIISMVFLVSCGGSANKNTEKENSQETALANNIQETALANNIQETALESNIQEQLGPLIETSAYDLYHSYNSNEIAADKSYQGKEIMVFGTIKNISKISGTIRVSLDGDGLLGTIDCTMQDSEESKVAELKKGSDITLQGFVEGMLMTSVDLDDCTIP